MGINTLIFIPERSFRFRHSTPNVVLSQRVDLNGSQANYSFGIFDGSKSSKIMKLLFIFKSLEI